MRDTWRLYTRRGAWDPRAAPASSPQAFRAWIFSRDRRRGLGHSPFAPIPGFLRGLNKKSLGESCATRRHKASSGSQGFGPSQHSSLSHTRLRSRPHTFLRITDPKRRAFGQRLGRPEGAVGLRSLLVESGWGPARGLGRSRHPLRGGGGGGREGGHGGVQGEVGRAAERPDGEPGRRPPPPPCRKSSPAWTTSSSTWRSPWSSSSGRSRCPFLAWTVSMGPGRGGVGDTDSDRRLPQP